MKYRTLFLLIVILTALLFSGGNSGARARSTCQDQCQQQYNQCLALGIDYYTCTQQRNYCLYHCH
ncbi:MAG TPA: hypothetical protein VM911_00170 [Pyrinomonadaceae bacterium]|jgi:hypothetical protein|nr:hypothetical protein [Pyrinomonadaceae bacterium]